MVPVCVCQDHPLDWSVGNRGAESCQGSDRVGFGRTGIHRDDPLARANECDVTEVIALRDMDSRRQFQEARRGETEAVVRGHPPVGDEHRCIAIR